MEAQVVNITPGSVVNEGTKDPRIATVAAALRKELCAAGFGMLEVNQIHSGEGRGQSVGVMGTVPSQRTDELSAILHRYSEAHPPRTLAWIVGLLTGHVYYWE